MKEVRDFIMGVDLGATKILAAAFRVERKGGIEALAQRKRKTPSTGKAAEIVTAIAETAREAMEEAFEAMPGSSCAGLGVAVPAPLDRARGRVRYAPNLGLVDFPLAAELERSLGLPVILENDVQAGVYGELRAGALRGRRHAVGVFVGTGIGGGIVLDGQIYRGSTGSAGEVGHMILHEGGALCGCGNYGCLEALASRSALARDGVSLAASGKSPILFEEAGTDFRRYRSSVFQKALDAEDPAVARAIDRQGFWIGVGLANLVNLLNPEAIVLGGGVVTRFGERIRKAARKAMTERLMPGLADTVEILLAELGDLAVAGGAALLASEAAEARAVVAAAKGEAGVPVAPAKTPAAKTPAAKTPATKP